MMQQLVDLALLSKLCVSREDLRTRLLNLKHELADWLQRMATRLHPPSPTITERLGTVPTTKLEPIQQVLLNSGVTERLFQEYEDHRASERRDEETGWLLLGLREGATAKVLATLPAGADRDAGEAHVQFNSEAQAVAMRVLFPRERRLKLLGVVHTHPGTLRHPSRGDWQGDREWVKQLPGQQGLFGIGTADPQPDDELPEHAMSQGLLRFDWYTLAQDEKRYQRQCVEVVPGPDLAADVRASWPTLEHHAAALDRIARTLAKVRFNVLPDAQLGLVIGLPEPEQTIQIVLKGRQRQMMYEHKGQALALNVPDEMELDQAIFYVLQLIARQS